MKTLTAILFVCCGQIACGDDADQTPLHLRIKDAVASTSSISFKSEDGLRTVSFRDGELEGGGAVEPIFIEISKVIWRIRYPESREVTLDEVKAIYGRYSVAVEKAGEKPKLELWLSKHSEDKLLLNVIEALCPTGKSTVWIRYFESYPRRIDPIFIHKPVPPKNQINPAQQGGAGQPATRPESKSEGGDKPQPESEGRSR
jgi:hypothetical protein